jgi:hypothetical protein
MHYLAPLLPYATLLTVIVGVVFGVATVLHGRRLRYLTVAASLVQSIQTDAFTHAMRRILELPEAVDPGVVLADSDAVHAAYVVGHVFEGLGVMVSHRLLPLDIVDELIGGYLRASWTRLEPYIALRRSTLGPTFAEWFEWLVLRTKERAACRVVGSA